MLFEKRELYSTHSFIKTSSCKMKALSKQKKNHSGVGTPGVEANNTKSQSTISSTKWVPKHSIRSLISRKLNSTRNPSVARYTSFPCHVYPKNYNPYDWNPKRLEEDKLCRETLLKTYGENSQIYHPGQYGDEVSDDDISIMTIEAKSFKAIPNAKECVVGSTCSLANTLSTSSTKTERSDWSSTFGK